QRASVNEQTMAGASNKAFEYLAAGLGLLVSDRPEWVTMFVAPGYALACDPRSPDSIATSIRRFMDDPMMLHEMGERGRQRVAAEWNYERQFKTVAERLTR
ncbi:MAG: glycosyltransferase family protein, partial [Candidatus Xenobia bacterium]